MKTNLNKAIIYIISGLLVFIFSPKIYALGWVLFGDNKDWFFGIFFGLLFIPILIIISIVLIIVGLVKLRKYSKEKNQQKII